MEIPYTVKPRPDTGLWNAKIGIWLFLASEVMLFGGLFSAYVFLRLGAEPGYWPKGLLNVPVGTFNTVILIASSVSIVFAWAALKLRNFNRYRWCMIFTLLMGTLFLGIKLGYEWPSKFHHFGAYIKPEALSKYEEYLGNEHLKAKGRPPRVEITGYLKNPEALEKGSDATEYKIQLDAANADPKSDKNDYPQFIPLPMSDKVISVAKEDVQWASMWLPKHSTFFAVYYTITGLHGLHVLGGLVMFAYFLFPVSTRLYQKDPDHLANRIECVGLFWHFVDLVWIFAFPLFYLL
jgi:cytochrome c oxidase subunit 3